MCLVGPANADVEISKAGHCSKAPMSPRRNRSDRMLSSWWVFQTRSRALGMAGPYERQALQYSVGNICSYISTSKKEPQLGGRAAGGGQRPSSPLTTCGPGEILHKPTKLERALVLTAPLEPQVTHASLPNPVTTMKKRKKI